MHFDNRGGRKQLTENIEVEVGAGVVEIVLGHAGVVPLIVHRHSTQLEQRPDKRDVSLCELIGEDGDDGRVVGEDGVVVKHPGDVGERVAVGDADKDDGGIDVCLGVVGSYGDDWIRWRGRERGRKGERGRGGGERGEKQLCNMYHSEM